MGQSLVFIVEDEVAAFLAAQAQDDPGAYVSRLLRRAMQRQQGHSLSNRAAAINDAGPDTSGYPDMQGHFYQ